MGTRTVGAERDLVRDRGQKVSLANSLYPSSAQNPISPKRQKSRKVSTYSQSETHLLYAMKFWEFPEHF